MCRARRFWSISCHIAIERKYRAVAVQHCHAEVGGVRTKVTPLSGTIRPPRKLLDPSCKQRGKLVRALQRNQMSAFLNDLEMRSRDRLQHLARSARRQNCPSCWLMRPGKSGSNILPWSTMSIADWFETSRSNSTIIPVPGPRVSSKTGFTSKIRSTKPVCGRMSASHGASYRRSFR